MSGTRHYIISRLAVSNWLDGELTKKEPHSNVATEHCLALIFPSLDFDEFPFGDWTLRNRNVYQLNRQKQKNVPGVDLAIPRAWGVSDHVRNAMRNEDGKFLSVAFLPDHKKINLSAFSFQPERKQLSQL